MKGYQSQAVSWSYLEEYLEEYTMLRMLYMLPQCYNHPLQCWLQHLDFSGASSTGTA